MRNKPFKFLEVNIDGQAFKLRSGYRYSAEGVWVKAIGGCPCMGQLAWVGISELFALQGRSARALTLPEKDTKIVRGESMARVVVQGEELNVASPISGKVIVANTLLEAEPDLVGVDSYDTGWLAILTPTEVVDKSELFTAEEYCKHMTEGVRSALSGHMER